MRAIVVCAVIFGCYAEKRRAGRARAYYQQYAERLSELEAQEMNSVSVLLNVALECERSRIRDAEWLRQLRTPAYQRFPNRMARSVEQTERAIEQDVKLESEALEGAQEAKSRAERLAIEKQSYVDAASHTWWPFWWGPILPPKGSSPGKEAP
jgi:hypothetical protein